MHGLSTKKSMKLVEVGLHADVAQKADLAPKAWSQLACEVGSLVNLHDMSLW